MRYLLALCGSFLIAAITYSAASHSAPVADSLLPSHVILTVEVGGDKITQSGFVIGDGNTVISFLDAEKPPTEVLVKADSDAERVASAIKLSSLGVLIMKVPGLNGAPLTFTKTPVDVGQIIYSLEHQSEPIKLVKGTVSKKIDWQKQEGFFQKKFVGPIHNLFIHNALLTETSNGSSNGLAILDECARVVGMNRTVPKDLIVNNNQDRLIEYALSVQQLVTELNLGATLAIDDSRCLSLEEQAIQKEKEKQQALEKIEATEKEKQVTENQLEAAEEKALEAKNKLEIAEEKLQQSSEQAELSEQEKQRLEEDIEQARIEFERTQVDIQAAKNKLAEQEKAAEQERIDNEEKLKQYAVIAAVILLLVILIAVIFLRRRKGQIQSAEKETEIAISRAKEAEKLAKEAEKPMAPFSCMLTGEDESGSRYLLKIDAQALGKTEGVILGRNPNNADFVIENEKISRANTRLFLQGDALFAEDLDSANGTSVDGLLLSPTASAKIVNGSKLSIGTVDFKVTLE